MESYRVCILGNSHLVAFQQSWSNWPPGVRADFSPAFFFALTPLLNTIKLRGSALITSDPDLRDRFEQSTGERRIELANYDAFVLVGLRFNFNIPEICGRYGTIDHARYDEGARQLLSRELFTRMLRAQFDGTDALRIAGMIRQRSPAPILISPVPLRMEATLDDEQFAGDARLRNPEFLEHVYGQFREAGAAAAKALNCEVLWQDPKTIARAAFTASQYSRASSGAARDLRDRWHGNDLFGRIHVDALLKRLDALSGGRVLAREETS